MKRVKQCLGALFSFSSIPKQQISPGLRQEISIPAQQVRSGAGFPCGPWCSAGGSSGFARHRWRLPCFPPCTGHGECPGLVPQGPLLACHIPGFLQKREIIFKRAVQCVSAGFFYLVGWVFNNSYELSGGCWVTACPGSCVTVRHRLVTGTSGCPQPSGHGWGISAGQERLVLPCGNSNCQESHWELVSSIPIFTFRSHALISPLVLSPPAHSCTGQSGMKPPGASTGWQHP